MLDTGVFQAGGKTNIEAVGLGMHQHEGGGKGRRQWFRSLENGILQTRGGRV